MKKPLLLPAIIALTACGPRIDSGRDGSRDFASVCADQAALAQAGLTGGGGQTITCPR